VLGGRVRDARHKVDKSLDDLRAGAGKGIPITSEEAASKKGISGDRVWQARGRRRCGMESNGRRQRMTSGGPNGVSMCAFSAGQMRWSAPLGHAGGGAGVRCACVGGGEENRGRLYWALFTLSGPGGVAGASRAHTAPMSPFLVSSAWLEQASGAACPLSFLIR
jgi:hypothetical protein